MILKQLIRYTNADALEATWVEIITLPQQEIEPGVLDQVLRTQEVVIKCRAYSNGQMDMLRADLGADAAAHAALIDEIEATYVPPEPEPQLSQFDLDKERYARRAAVKDSLIAWMAADNISRVRSGVWSVAELTGLMADPAVASANAYMSTLSFELAAQSIMAATSPMLTPAIKAVWVGKLQDHFYL